MIGWRHFGFEFLLLVVICIGALFFFPVAHGSYSAVHGPVTALRSLKYRLQIWLVSVISALRPLSKRPLGDLCRFFRACTDFGFFDFAPAQIPVLRC